MVSHHRKHKEGIPLYVGSIIDRGLDLHMYLPNVIVRLILKGAAVHHGVEESSFTASPV